jgi:hypothetical protein
MEKGSCYVAQAAHELVISCLVSESWGYSPLRMLDILPFSSSCNKIHLTSTNCLMNEELGSIGYDLIYGFSATLTSETGLEALGSSFGAVFIKPR